VTAAGFTVADDGLHRASAGFHETESFRFSFFVPERALGAWLSAAVRQNVGVTAGGLCIWDDSGVRPEDAPFYEHFTHLEPPEGRFPDRLEFPTGMTVTVCDPGRVYALRYDDRDRVLVDLRFEALEPAVPLQWDQQTQDAARHYDQTGRVTGVVELDGERIDVDCWALRDRSWGPHPERGSRKVGCTWGADPAISWVAHTAPGDGSGPAEEVHAGYLRRGQDVAPLTGGTRSVVRDPRHGWVTGIDLELTDLAGRVLHAQADVLSRLVLPGATALCVSSVLRWDVEGRVLHGEDQDVWPLAEWRSARRAGGAEAHACG
jgi:hypothetical protein